MKVKCPVIVMPVWGIRWAGLCRTHVSIYNSDKVIAWVSISCMTMDQNVLVK